MSVVCSKLVVGAKLTCRVKRQVDSANRISSELIGRLLARHASVPFSSVASTLASLVSASVTNPPIVATESRDTWRPIAEVGMEKGPAYESAHIYRSYDRKSHKTGSLLNRIEC